MTNPLRCHVCHRSKFRCECGWVIAGIAASVISAAVGAYGAYSQGQQAEQAAKGQQQALTVQGQVRQGAAQTQADILQERNRHFLAEQRAQASGGGLDSTGSPLDVMIASSQQAELDRQRALYGGTVDTMGLTYQGQLARYKGSQATTAANIGAGSTLLTGALQAASLGRLYRSGTPNTNAYLAGYGGGFTPGTSRGD